MVKIKNSRDKDVEQEKHSFIDGGSANLYNCFENQFADSSENRLDLSPDPSIPLLGRYVNEAPQGHLLNYVHTSFIHNSQKLETT